MSMENDLKIAGSGSVSGGEYRHIAISGSGRIHGDVLCESFRVSGSASGKGSITCRGEMKCAGAFRIDGDVTAEEELKISGSCTVDGDIRGGEIAIAGALRGKSLHGKRLRLAGGLTLEGDAEAEEAHLSGGGRIGGLLNAETVRIRLGSGNGRLTVGSVGGTDILVESEGAVVGLFSRLFGGRRGRERLVTTLIEGDTVELCYTECDVVRGSRVVIGEGCRIGRVEYSESYDCRDDASVREAVKV